MSCRNDGGNKNMREHYIYDSQQRQHIVPILDIVGVEAQYVDNCSLAGMVMKPTAHVDAGNTADAKI